MKLRITVLCTLGTACARMLAQSGPGGVGTAASNVLWISADNNIALAGANVTNWNDRSGNNNNATCPSVAARPTLVTASLNGYPIVSFDGVNDEMRIPDANALDLIQWDVFLVNAVTTAKTNNVWMAKGTNTQPNYALWSPLNNALQMPIYDIFGLLSSPSTGAGAAAASFNVLEYNNTVILGLFPSRTIYKNGSNIYNDVNLLQLPAANNNQLYIGNAQGAAGWNLNGSLGELIMYNTPVNSAQRIIVNNYLAAKYGLTLATNDIYVQDNPLNGNYDHEVAGIGRVTGGNQHTDSRGSAVVRINNPGGLGDNEFLLWGHDNGVLGAWGSMDRPAGVQGRWFRVWRVSEVNTSGVAVDVGNVDMTFDLTGQGPVTASDLRLLVDINNNGVFADDAPVPIAATSLGGNLYRFGGVSQLVNGRRFTLGTININQTPLPIELLYFSAIANSDRTVSLDWATASESQNDLFTVQRSPNGEDWTDVLEVPGAGESHSELHYGERDVDPLPGLSYYRLLQSDRDGAHTCSSVIPVRIDPEASELLVFPDPAQDVVNVLFDPSSGHAELHLINDLGQEFLVPIVPTDGGAQLDVRPVPAGSYSMVMISDHQVLKQRLIIAR